jgi:hypothetical protein
MEGFLCHNYVCMNQFNLVNLSSLISIFSIHHLLSNNGLEIASTWIYIHSMREFGCHYDIGHSMHDTPFVLLTMALGSFDDNISNIVALSCVFN